MVGSATAMLNQFAHALMTITPSERMKSVTLSSKEIGRSSSIWLMSLLKRFNIRPAGLMSKNRMADWTTPAKEES